MQKGAVAIMDFLGFKGIWNRPDVKANDKAFLDALRDMHASLMNSSNLMKPFETDKIKLASRGTMLSDTMVLALSTTDAEVSNDPEKTREFDNHCVHALCKFAAVASAYCAEAPMKLGLRGCITIGEFFIEKNILMGPAIDEAAQLHELSQGAFVWMSPVAAKVVNVAVEKGGEEDEGAVAWNVPLKGGEHIETRVSSPIYAATTQDKAIDIVTNILETFDHGNHRVDVWQKYQNTKRFLESTLAMRFQT